MNGRRKEQSKAGTGLKSEMAKEKEIEEFGGFGDKGLTNRWGIRRDVKPGLGVNEDQRMDVDRISTTIGF